MTAPAPGWRSAHEPPTNTKTVTVLVVWWPYVADAAAHPIEDINPAMEQWANLADGFWDSEQGWQHSSSNEKVVVAWTDMIPKPPLSLWGTRGIAPHYAADRHLAEYLTKQSKHGEPAP